MKNLPLLLCVLVLILLPVPDALRSSFGAESAGTAASRPNFLIIVTDDQRPDTFNQSFMPKSFARIAAEGLLFEKAFVTTPHCCPSRASIFTGLLARHHGIARNGSSIRKSNFDEVHRFPLDLRAAGYKTALVGKFLNSWNGTWRNNEFDYWVSYPRGTIDDWFNYQLIYNDQTLSIQNQYITDKLSAYAVRFLNKALQSGKPFMLYFAPIAPHAPGTPSPRHLNAYQGLPVFRPPSFNESDISDKPSWFRKQVPLLTAGEIASLDALRLSELRSLLAVDEAVDTMLTLLDQAGVLKNTVVIFTSDNSVFWGEHRLQGKGLFYEESVHVPLAIRYPKILSTSAPRIESKKLVANIDIAPTIYELAGLPIPSPIDGLSLVPLFSDTSVRWRKELFLEAWPDTFKGDGAAELCSPPYTAIRTARYVYAETHANDGTDAPCTYSRPQRPELYDLKYDPFQLNNLEGNVLYQDVLTKLKTRLDAYGYVEFPQ